MYFSLKTNKYLLETRLKKAFRAITGHHSEFTLENRLFNVINIIALVAISIALPMNYILHYPGWVLAAMGGLLLLQLYMYYLSRFRKKFQVSRVLFAVFSYAFLTLNFFYNTGIDGPTIMCFFLSYVFLIAIYPRKTYWLWTSLHLINVIVLIWINYSRPDMVPNSYADVSSRSIDLIVSFMLILLLSYATLNFIRANYDYEKWSADNKAQTIQLHNVELEKVNAEKNKLFSILSHDLRSPLNTIQSYLELLSLNMLDETEKTTVKNELLDLTKNTSDLLFNLLSWSKTQMEGVNVKILEQNLFNALASTINTQHTIAAQKDIRFENNMDKNAIALCDEDMLQLVIRNLLNNAIKFTPSFGKISISTVQQEKAVIIAVSDNGPGILKDQQKEIFSLKIRSTYGTNNEKGIGLGLVLCKDYIELQHGRIWFDSVPDEGTTFYISLPKA